MFKVSFISPSGFVDDLLSREQVAAILGSGSWTLYFQTGSYTAFRNGVERMIILK